MMHSTDQNGIVVEGKQRDMMREGARERLATQIPPSRRRLILVRCYRFVLSSVGHWFILWGSQLQSRAKDLPIVTDTSHAVETPIQET